MNIRKALFKILIIFNSVIVCAQVSPQLSTDNTTISSLSLPEGSCGSPDGVMNSIPFPAPTYNWLDSNGYCYPNTYGTNPTVCWTVNPSSSSISINTGYAYEGICPQIPPEFGNFILYDSLCNIFGTGLNYSELIPGNIYTWCMTGLLSGGGPNCIGFTNFCPYFLNISLLPIKLIDFDVKNIENINHIIWSTSFEKDNNYFLLERKGMNGSWKEITTINSNGDSDLKTEYLYKDVNFNNTINYYRLTQFDYNGNSETFNIISIDNNVLNKKLIKSVNIMGQEINHTYKGLIINVYSDGSTESFFNTNNNIKY